MMCMAYDAMSPLGLSWGYLALLLLPVLLFLVAALAWFRRSNLHHRLWLLLFAALLAGLWTLLRVGSAVKVYDPHDPDGSQCLVDPVGRNPDRVVSWGTDCGHALATHLVLSVGPTLIMIGVLIATLGRAGFRRHLGEVQV